MTKIIVLKDNHNKICTKASRSAKKINKEELEALLTNESIMGQDKYTLREAKKIKYIEACQILLEKNVLEEIEVIPEDSIIDCNNLTFQDLKNCN